MAPRTQFDKQHVDQVATNHENVSTTIDAQVKSTVEFVNTTAATSPSKMTGAVVSAATQWQANVTKVTQELNAMAELMRTASGKQEGQDIDGAANVGRSDMTVHLGG